MIKEPHNHKEASGSVTIIEEVSQSWSEDISRPGRSPPPPPPDFFRLGRFAPGRFGPGRFDRGHFWSRSFRPCLYWLGRFAPWYFGPGRFAPGRFGPGRFAPRTFRHRTFWTCTFRSQTFRTRTFHPPTFWTRTFHPLIIVYNTKYMFQLKFCHLGEFTSNFSWRCFTIHVTFWRYFRDYTTLLEVTLKSMRH